MDGPPPAPHRNAGLVGAGLLGQHHGGTGAGGVDGAADVGPPAGVRAKAGLAGADLIIARAGDAAVGQQARCRMLPTGPAIALSPLRSVGPLSRSAAPRPPAAVRPVTVGAVDGQAVGKLTSSSTHPAGCCSSDEQPVNSSSATESKGLQWLSDGCHSRPRSTTRRRRAQRRARVVGPVVEEQDEP